MSAWKIINEWASRILPMLLVTTAVFIVQTKALGVEGGAYYSLLSGLCLIYAKVNK